MIAESLTLFKQTAWLQSAHNLSYHNTLTRVNTQIEPPRRKGRRHACFAYIVSGCHSPCSLFPRKAIYAM